MILDNTVQAFPWSCGSTGYRNVRTRLSVSTTPSDEAVEGMSDTPILSIRNLTAKVADEDIDILKGVDLDLFKGEIHAIMGPNGSGKSTLTKVLAGHPGYEVTGGTVTFHGEDILEMEPDERSQAGVFLAFQYPVEIPGVSIANFLRTALQARLEEGEELDLFDFQDELMARMEMLEMDPTFAERPVNDGFSGGEKKRNEILQMAMLRPSWRSWTRPTRGWTSTPSRSWPPG
jgi:Fe-S cluster assembly ATP-binding protein